MGLSKSREGGFNISSKALKSLRNLGFATLIATSFIACNSKPNLKKMSLPELQAYLCDLTSKINDGADVQGLIAGEHNIGVDGNDGRDKKQVNNILQGTSSRGDHNTIRFEDAIKEINRVKGEIDERIANGENGISNYKRMDPKALDHAREIINEQQKLREEMGY